MKYDLLPVVDTINVLVLLKGPVFGNIDHTDFLALVDEGCTGLEAEELGEELGAVDAVLG